MPRDVQGLDSGWRFDARSIAAFAAFSAGATAHRQRDCPLAPILCRARCLNERAKTIIALQILSSTPKALIAPLAADDGAAPPMLFRLI